MKLVSLCSDDPSDPMARKLSVATEQGSSKPRTPDQCRRPAGLIIDASVPACTRSSFLPNSTSATITSGERRSPLTTDGHGRSFHLLWANVLLRAHLARLYR